MWKAYLEMCKPRVVLLMLITAYVGMQMASLSLVPVKIASWGLIGIGLMASAAAVINHVVDQHVDSIMARTRLRPLPTGKISTIKALIFSITLGIVGFIILLIKINWLTSLLTFFTLIGYAVIYTMYLKRVTPQNIVWGGLSGAMPPLLGWTAVSGQLDFQSLILVAIIFVWTPPHFWALAIYRYNEYEKVHDIPMLPITHGIRVTKIHILLYSILLLPVSCLPVIVKISGLFYLVVSIILGVCFLYYAIRLKKSEDPLWGRILFHYSIIYLFVLFIAIFIDHYTYHEWGI